MAFFSTYGLYKQGTRTIVNWLATTAAQCGYESLDQKKKRNNKNKNKNRKLKAKCINVDTECKAENLIPSAKSPSRTLAVDVQNGTNDKIPEAQSTSQSQKYIVPTKDLPRMATFISERFEKVSDLEALPKTLEVLKDVIAKRKQWSTEFAQKDPSTLSSNGRHEHFVTILEEVQQILGGVMTALNLHQAQRSVEKTANTASLSKGERALNNIFAVLKLEDPADMDENIVEPTNKSQPTKAATPTYELEEDENVDNDDILFRIHCFFNDFIDMRNHLRRSWGDYVSGIVDLVPVAVSTNVAIEMLQRAETELLESIPKKYCLTTYVEIATVLYASIAKLRGVDSEARQKPGDVINVELSDIADFTSLPVYIILSSFLPVIQNGLVPVLKPGIFGERDISGRPLSWRDRFEQHKIILLELLPDFCMVSRLDRPPPVVDEITRGLLQMVETREIPMWLVLSCQLYLDIHDVTVSHPMGSMDVAHKELQRMGLHATQTLQSYAEFSKNVSIETWPKANDKILQAVRTETEEWINKDIYFRAQKQSFESNKLPASKLRRYSLFSRHPLLCGLMLFRLNMRMQDAGITLVNAWGSVPSVLHLYNAIKHESPGADVPRWEDLEAVIDIHGKDRIFIGDYPDNAEQYLKRFCLVLGWSGSMFAQNRRGGRNTKQTQTPASKRGPREMMATSAIADICKPQYAGREGRPEVTFHKIQELLRATSKKQQLAAPFLPVSFLASLQQKMQDDILALNIDYVALHMRCTDLLRNIHSSLHLDLTKYLQSENYMEKESELPFLVGYLFTIAVGSAKAVELLKIGGRGIKTTSRTLLKAAELVKDLVLKEGGKEVRRVEEYCRGYDWLSDGESEISVL